MSELDDALQMLERAVRRLEAAPLGDGAVAARLAAEHEAADARMAATAGEAIARVDAALAKISQVLDGDC